MYKRSNDEGEKGKRKRGSFAEMKEGSARKTKKVNTAQPMQRYVPPVILAEMVSGGFFESMIACVVHV
jgi:hypothetical protein